MEAATVRERCHPRLRCARFKTSAQGRERRQPRGSVVRDSKRAHRAASGVSRAAPLCAIQNELTRYAWIVLHVHHVAEIVICVAGVAALFALHREIAEAIDTFRNNFPRGGPPTPMHPSVAGDDAHLRPGSRKRTAA